MIRGNRREEEPELDGIGDVAQPPVVEPEVPELERRSVLEEGHEERQREQADGPRGDAHPLRLRRHEGKRHRLGEVARGHQHIFHAQHRGGHGKKSS